jgi:uncharacterized protein (DUF1501 family)
MLFESRDLRPTVRFESVVSGAIAHHFQIDPNLARKTMFPDFV